MCDGNGFCAAALHEYALVRLQLRKTMRQAAARCKGSLVNYVTFFCLLERKHCREQNAEERDCRELVRGIGQLARFRIAAL